MNFYQYSYYTPQTPKTRRQKHTEKYEELPYSKKRKKVHKIHLIVKADDVLSAQHIAESYIKKQFGNNAKYCDLILTNIKPSSSPDI